MLNFLQHRHREDEWMDAPDADPAALGRSLRFIRWVNRLLGYSRATVKHLEKFSRSWNSSQQIKILDVATGSGDIPRSILRWASRKKFNVEIVCIDLHLATVQTATRLNTDPRLKFVRADATQLPFADRAFDYVLTGMFLHHLDEAAVQAVFREMDRVAKQGVIAADLLRSRRAYFWIVLLTLLANPMVRHDARVSVAGAFNEAELLRLRDSSGLTYLKPKRHFGHRLVLAGLKG